MEAVDGTKVLLNVTRSEAEELLREQPPPRPASLRDSAASEPMQHDLYAQKVHELEEHSPKGYLEHEKELHGRAPELKLWAPPSRSSGASSAGAARPALPAVNGGPSSGAAAEFESAPPYYSHERHEPAPTPGTPAAAPQQQATAVVQGRVQSSGEARAELREMDVRAAFAGLPKVKPHWTHRYMKILLVGESGLGKTTFVRNLFAAYAKDASFPVNDASVPNAQRLFVENPERLCTEIVLQDSESKVYYHYLVQDTPGYGDSTDLAADRRVILDYVEDCCRSYLEQEQDPERKAAMHAIKDTRVDVCLYFIPPHRLRQIDLQFMSELAMVVPVVPVLAKADTMTTEELKEFRHVVRAALERQVSSGAGGAAGMWRFSRDALEDAGARHGPPFAIIGSNTMDLEVGRFWPVRKYPWGSVEAMLTQHSDLPVLRRLLFESGYLELKDDTERRFHEYRHAHCGVPGGRRAGWRIKAKLGGLVRVLLLGGGLAAAGWLMTSGAPLLKDEVTRKETVRRVKEKVGEVVEQAVDTVHDVSGKAQDAAAIAKSTTTAAADVTKRAVNQAAAKAGRALETEEQRKKREEATQPRTVYKRKPWWQFWGEREAEERRAKGWGWLRPGKLHPKSQA